MIYIDILQILQHVHFLCPRKYDKTIDTHKNGMNRDIVTG